MGSCLSSDQWAGAASSPLTPARTRSGKLPRRRTGSFGFEYKGDVKLQNIPGRYILNSSSPISSLFTKQGKKGPNQDAMIVWENFGPKKDAIFCAVFDGHGPWGHMVARKVRDQLPLRLNAQWNTQNAAYNDPRENGTSANEESNIPLDDEEDEEHPEIFSILEGSFSRAFDVMDKELLFHPIIDCNCSGTTAVTLIKQGEDLVIGNVGDSRAILGTKDKNDCLSAVQLTVDLKPSVPSEAERIKSHRGRVFPHPHEPDVARVWLPNSQFPGLAMARALGDFCLKDFGLISAPEMSYRRLTAKDEFIVLATDGIWDVLSNEEVINVVASSPTQSAAAQHLVEAAVLAWKHKYPTSKIDDCAVVCLFLNVNLPSSSASYTTSKDTTESSDTLEMNDKNNTTPMMRYGLSLFEPLYEDLKEL